MEFKKPNDLSGLMQAEVRDNIDPLKEGRIKVFIPRLMYDHDYKEKPIDNETNGNCFDKIVNKKDFNSPQAIADVNYIWARPFQLYENNSPNWKFGKFSKSGTYKVPRVGSIITIFFLDDDPHKCYYLNNSPTATDEVDKETIDGYWACKEENWKDPDKKPNIDVIRFYWNKQRIEVDTNEGLYENITSNGNMIKNHDDYQKIERYDNHNKLEVTKDYVKIEDGISLNNTKVLSSDVRLESGNSNGLISVNNDRVLIKFGNTTVILTDQGININGPVYINGSLFSNSYTEGGCSCVSLQNNCNSNSPCSCEIDVGQSCENNVGT